MGYFFESFNSVSFNSEVGQNINFVQDNHSFSNHGAIRAIHYQTGEHIATELSGGNKKQLFIPRGFGAWFFGFIRDC